MLVLLDTPRLARHVVLAALGLALVAGRPARRAPTGQLLFALRVDGAEYVRLADDELPAHAPPRLVEQAGVAIAIADVQPRDLPAGERAWLGRAVRVDARCTAAVTGFAVIARLAGEPRYAGEQALTWTATSVLAHGQLVLAARLDRCDGTYARDASLADPIEPVAIDDPVLALRARLVTLASEPARAAQREWEAAGRSGAWFAADAAAITTEVFRHPATGTRWVSVHAALAHDCADPSANVWGLFRVSRDGALVPEQLRALSSIETIERLIDVDRDGRWEVLGRPWLELDRVLETASGDELDRLGVPLFGCSC